MPIAFDNSYARLPDRFFARLDPTPVAEPKLVKLNRDLARDLGIDPAELETEAAVAALAGNGALPGTEPLAMAYAGHQFGGWSGQLGDGRALLLGEVVDGNGQRRDIQLKGSGPTPFSRSGDGRAPLGPVIREYVVSEAMHRLGVPTTRALAAVATGEPVYREAMLPGGVLTRVAASHIRVGTFQFFGAQRDREALRLLTEHALARHYPDRAEQGARGILDAVVEAQAALVAKWMGLGFIHGVMNTDNMTISGETIDFGPCAFMEGYEADKVFSSIDQFGRYAYNNQPQIAQWNLAQLAVSLIPLLGETEEAGVEQAKAALDRYPDLFSAARRAEMRAKFALIDEADGDDDLIGGYLTMMAETQADYTLSFRHLAEAAEGDGAPLTEVLQHRDLEPWLASWRARLGADAPDRLRAANPLYIPRNHLVEEAIAAAYQDDFGPFETLVAVLDRPFDAQSGQSRFAAPATPEEAVTRTFCGT
ncbi:MAG: YdiU family protein [Pseudomonadota bacterium]